MKKLLISFITAMLFAASLTASSFSDFFINRFFEFGLKADAGLSTNAILIEDILKDELIIDLRQIADDLPDYGFNLGAQANSSVNFKIDIPRGIYFGLDVGVDVFSSVTISKELFNFLGYGNELNEELIVTVDGYTDVFAYVQPSFGWNFKKGNFTVSPAAFSAIAHGSIENSNITALNNADGIFHLLGTANMNVYSPVDLSKESITIENLMSNVPALISSIGYDISGHLDFDAFRYLSLYFDTRIPIMPSRLSKLTVYSASIDTFVSIDGFTGGHLNSEIPSSDDPNPPKTGDFNFSWENTQTEDVDKTYYVNRPMKFFVGGKFHPFQEVMYYYGGIGLGVEHAFTTDMSPAFFPEYILGAHLSTANILNLDFSTRYTDKIFCHQATFGLNIRFVEINVGLSSRSADFVSSLNGSGLGAFVTACIGF